MQKNSIKSTDELIQGIRVILSKNCCSFSADERVLLNDCISLMEQMGKTRDLQAKADLFTKVAGILVKIFTAADHIKKLF